MPHPRSRPPQSTTPMSSTTRASSPTTAARRSTLSDRRQSLATVCVRQNRGDRLSRRCSWTSGRRAPSAIDRTPARVRPLFRTNTIRKYIVHSVPDALANCNAPNTTFTSQYGFMSALIIIDTPHRSRMVPVVYR